ncbi:antibiotic biosynthesis monooxygenase family protein [Spirosoma utsteinense]|uniref:antibiotic biosynthesis monooxygenase family protein n=1 Tax=Spirosoma utsteinense TaxID=2585773 RepID=UPI0016448B55|nr:antibiotic biosynthesis monooxygenase [Spirosoma utsteinense]MBC3787796.1 heme-degrading monooxygenase HmoA [Spirosoma utsteinense]
MYARIVQVPLQPGAVAEATAYFRESVGPALKGHSGFFLNSRFLVDEEKNRCMMVTLWESAEARTEAETNGFLQDVLQKMKKHFAGSPVIDYYHVPVQVI